ncbi:AAA family ATPase, partial [candidate division KSB1 bacterium]|nr:AAA family ATPase [candidate division KSB1 bacterium]
MMYLKYYNFTELPFLSNSDPRFEIITEKYQEAYARLKYAIQEGNGFALLTGDKGTGKSFLITRIIRELPENFKITRVSGAQLSAISLLRSLCRSFKLKVSGTKEELLVHLNQYLNRYETKEKAVVFIEDAHLLKPAFLEEIRLLSNLETASYKLIQIILVGQPSFHQILGLPQLRQLKQRISIEAALDRLNFTATKHYIKQRLKIAGCSNINLFTEQAFESLYLVTNGTPAKINYYADRALFFGYLQQQSSISHLIIQQINLLEQHENEKNGCLGDILKDDTLSVVNAPGVMLPFKRTRVRWITGLFILIFSMIFIYELNLNRKLTYLTDEKTISLNQSVLIDSLFWKNQDLSWKKM